MAKHTFILNGKRVHVECRDDVRLLWVLRDLLGVTGPKYGCGLNVCKACTSHINGKAFNPCSVPVSKIKADDEITTIEGLAAADGTLHPMQQAFHNSHALQCGFCTPGMVMAAIDLLNNNPDPTEDEVREGLEGNLCRCTGYQNIVKAVLAAAQSTEASISLPEPAAQNAELTA